MTPTEVIYGVRYSDDSGWERRVELDARMKSVSVDIAGYSFRCDFEEMHWLLNALLDARDALGMDKFQRDLPALGRDKQ